MKCIGFGQYEGKCTNEAEGSTRNPLWCDRCDALRLDHISKQLDMINKKGEQVIGKIPKKTNSH